MLIDQINKYSQQLEVLLIFFGGGSGMEIEGIILITSSSSLRGAFT